jgi:type IX secretion system PorP/SprF family membrane protein
MKRFFLIILLLSFPFILWGQLFPLSDHYVYDALAINPAFAGCKDALSATILYRNQWVGFTDAPKKQMLSLHTPLHHDRVGLGLLVENNTIGIFKETSIIGNYAYRMELRHGKLALGLGFGLRVHNIAWNELNAADANDVQLMNNSNASVLPAFSLGAYYYTKKYYIGLSMPLFLNQKIDQKTGNYKNTYNLSEANYFLSGGADFVLSHNLKLIPSMLVKYYPQNYFQVDYNALVSYKDRIWLGMGYRNQGMLVAMIQFQLNYQLKLSYAYDFDLGSLGQYRNGSHEIVLNYVFRYSRKVIGPRQF